MPRFGTKPRNQDTIKTQRPRAIAGHTPSGMHISLAFLALAILGLASFIFAQQVDLIDAISEGQGDVQIPSGDVDAVASGNPPVEACWRSAFGRGVGVPKKCLDGKRAADTDEADEDALTKTGLNARYDDKPIAKICL